MNSYCRNCMYDKHLDQYPEGIGEKTRQEYQDAVKTICEGPGCAGSGAEANARIVKLRSRMFGEKGLDYAQIKRHYNELMLSLEEEIREKIRSSADPLGTAVRYAMTGNYIDFAALENVTEKELEELLGKAQDIRLDENVLEDLRQKIGKARSLVYITDNCGEIVLDKLLMRECKRLNPSLEMTVILRSKTAVNDAEIGDAEQVGLTKIARCVGNGTDIDGTVLRLMPREVREAVMGADLILAKGMANYETMRGCGLPVFYLFLCKCSLFEERFRVDHLAGVLAEEDPLEQVRENADPALSEKYLFRYIHRGEAEEAEEIERVCFPPNEACSPEEMRRRVDVDPGQFLVAVDRQSGRIAGFLNGIAVQEDRLRDEFFTDMSLHDPAADTVFILSLDVLPQYRGQGIARELMRLYGIQEKVKGRRRMVLTAHKEKVEMYRKMGFRDKGVSDSVWGGGPWREMDMPL